MNPKHLIPTWRTRYRLVESLLGALGPFDTALNLGCGEGDMDAMIRGQCERLESCDINPQDVAFARALNRDAPGIAYSVQDGLALSFADGAFDLVVSIDVVEHVADQARFIAEITRVLRPGGTLIITCPSHDFPVTYDPVNLLLRRAGWRLPFGAYGYGHTTLIEDDTFSRLLLAQPLGLIDQRRLSYALVGAAEMYWPSVIQRLLKANRGNRDGLPGRWSVRPRLDIPAAARAVDLFTRLDAGAFSWSDRSIGLAYVLERLPGDPPGAAPARATRVAAS